MERTMETQKLENVRKSCRITAIIVRIFEILSWIGFALTTIGAVLLFVFADKIDQAIAAGQAEGMSINIHVGGIVGFFSRVSDTDARTAATMLIFIAVICLLTAIALTLVRSSFALIAKSETPFSELISSRLKISFIIITAAIALAAGLGFAVITGLIFWSFYCILEYGRLLQQQADETL